jgi:hypothetical protein
VGRQWLGRYGRTDNGVVTVTTVWADERVYYPVHAVPYTPPGTSRRENTTPAFQTKLVIGAELAVAAREADSRSARWPRTAPTGTRTGSGLSWRKRDCRWPRSAAPAATADRPQVRRVGCVET